jgi:hypothetical protein
MNLKMLALGTVFMTAASLVADPLVVSSIKITPKMEGKTWPELAKVSLQEAVEIAKAATGKNHTLMCTIDVNWHDEKTGYLVYDIDSVGDTKGAVTAVFVDPGNGKVLAKWEEDWINGVSEEEKADKAKEGDEKDGQKETKE